jgi:hypothetical protein
VREAVYINSKAIRLISLCSSVSRKKNGHWLLASEDDFSGECVGYTGQSAELFSLKSFGSVSTVSSKGLAQVKVQSQPVASLEPQLKNIL